MPQTPANKAFTAKVICTNKAVNDQGYVSLNFIANFIDAEGKPVNQDWAYATPHMGIATTVRAEVGELFEQSKSYNVTFTPDKE